MKILLWIFCLVVVALAIAAFFQRKEIARLNAENAMLAKDVINLEHELETAKNTAEGLAENARACLAREAKAQADFAERQTIMRDAQPGERTEDEKEKVVDDVTRSRVVERLNRDL